MRFEVLGPLRVCASDGAEIVIRSRHRRTVLGMLLLRSGQAVSADQLVEALWGAHPPASHVSNLQTYVSRLRELLPDVAIEHVNGCYRLSVEPRSLDAAVFRREVADGRAALARGDAAAAAAALRRGLGLWRGRPLADLSVVLLAPEIAQLEAERLAAVEDRFEAELDLPGTANDLVAELNRAITEHPLRERLRGQLLVALCRAGRRADALVAYQQARQTLVDELGIEPGPQLRRLHQAILRGDEPGTGHRTVRVPPAPPVFPVCQLPPPVAGFVGRAGAVGTVAAALAPDPAAVPIAVVSGQPGVGKTALAVGVAHRVRSAFPDGQLFAHLAGASPVPREPAAVLADLLRALGVAGSAIPQDLAALSAAFRTRLADRKVLVVLDDVADPAQVRALTPGTPGCAVLVTSRSRLSGLTDATHLPLGPLTDDEARQLLARVAGPDRIADAASDTTRIATACGNLPLALRIAGTRLATRGLRPAVLADRLDDQRRRLTELAISDQQVRASLALGVQVLSPPTRRAFELLGLLGPESFPGWAVAALVGAAEADGILDELVEASLLEPVPAATGDGDGYRLHDLLRVYAAELAASADTGGALRRLLAVTIDLAETAALRLSRTLTWSHPVPAAEPAPAVRGVRARVAADPLTWFTAQRSFLVSTVLAAAAAGHDRQAVLLAERLAPYLWIGGHWIDLDRIQQTARQAAERAGDERAGLLMEFVGGVLRLVRGDLSGAASALDTAAAGFERLDDRHGLACVLSDLAVLCDYRNRAEDAVRTARRAVELFEAGDDRHGVILASPALSGALRWLGRLPEALAVDLAAVATARTERAAPIVLARCLNALAVTHLLSGDPARAHAAAAEAVGLLDPAGDRYVLLAALRQLALATAGLGRRPEAVRLLERSHAPAVELGDRVWATGLTKDIAVSWIGEGRVAEATAALLRCLRTYHAMGLRSGLSSTLAMLARAYDAAGRTGAARAARAGAHRLADPRDARTPALSGIVLSLAEPVVSGAPPVRRPLPAGPDSAAQSLAERARSRTAADRVPAGCGTSDQRKRWTYPQDREISS